jgi:protein-S-isoprenylcysteine O-methyltransferase Ste14
MKNEALRQVLGYILGGALALIAVPGGLYWASRCFDNLINIQLIVAPALRAILSLLLLATGAIFALWSIIIQNVVGQGGPLEVGPLQVSPKTKNLVVTGPYRYTRNPMLFGAFNIYYSIAIYLNSPAALILASLLLFFMLSVEVKAEEKRLSRDFGEAYEDYRRRVSAFFPWFRKRS